MQLESKRVYITQRVSHLVTFELGMVELLCEGHDIWRSDYEHCLGVF